MDAGNASWAFALPQPTVTHTPATPATVPDQPTGLAATATHDTVSLTWDDPSDSSITSYQILRRDVTGGGSLVVHIDSVPAGTSYDDSTDVDPENGYSVPNQGQERAGLERSIWLRQRHHPGRSRHRTRLRGRHRHHPDVWTPNTAITSVTVPAASGSPAPTYAVVGALPAGISFSTIVPASSAAPRPPRAQARSESGPPTPRAVDDWTSRLYDSGGSPWAAGRHAGDRLGQRWHLRPCGGGRDGRSGQALSAHHAGADAAIAAQGRRRGRLEAKLWNRDAKYDPLNSSSSPIFEKDLTGVRVRAQLDGVTVCLGWNP